LIIQPRILTAEPKLDGKPLSDAQDEPERQEPDGNEQHANQPTVAYSPARQSESDTDQGVHQEEKDQKEVQLGMHVLSHLQWQQDSVRPCIA